MEMMVTPRTERARELRNNPTAAEKRLWQRLRRRQIAGALFRRQFWVGNYIVDFCCPELRLVIEVDGHQHAEQKDADENRSEFLASRGHRVLRFWNDEVLHNIEAVLEIIMTAVTERKTSPP